MCNPVLSRNLLGGIGIVGNILGVKGVEKCVVRQAFVTPAHSLIPSKTCSCSVVPFLLTPAKGLPLLISRLETFSVNPGVWNFLALGSALAVGI